MNIINLPNSITAKEGKPVEKYPIVYLVSTEKTRTQRYVANNLRGVLYQPVYSLGTHTQTTTAIDDYGALKTTTVVYHYVYHNRKNTKTVRCNGNIYQVHPEDVSSDRSEVEKLPAWFIDKDTNNPYIRRNGKHSVTARVYNEKGKESTGCFRGACFGGLRLDGRLKSLSNHRIVYDANVKSGTYSIDDPVLTDDERQRFMKLSVEHGLSPAFNMKQFIEKSEYDIRLYPKKMSTTTLFLYLVNARYTVEQPAMVWDILNLVDNHGWDFLTAWTACHFNHMSYDSEHNAIYPYRTHIGRIDGNICGNGCSNIEQLPNVSAVKIAACDIYYYLHYTIKQPDYAPMVKYGDWHLQIDLHRSKLYNQSHVNKMRAKILALYLNEKDLVTDLENWSPTELIDIYEKEAKRYAAKK